jgi:hypothetical protein
MTEPWIRVHANIASKPVIWRAVTALGVSENEAIGLLVRFWGAVSQNVVNGDLTGVPDPQIEAWAGWKRKRGLFAAFIRSSHTDPSGRVNEWDEYAGTLETRRAKDRARKADERAKKSRGSHADRPQDVTLVSIPNETTTKRDETGTEFVASENGQIAGVVIGQPAEYALQCTVAANRAITAKWGEQIHPLLHGHSYALADALIAAGVTLEVARENIALQCERSQKPAPPKSINWFRDGVLQHHAESQQRALQVANGESGRRLPSRPVKGKPQAFTYDNPTNDETQIKWQS